MNATALAGRAADAAASGHAASGHSASGDAASGYAASGHAAPDFAAPGTAAPDLAASRFAAPGSAASGYAASGHAAPDCAAPGTVAPDLAASRSAAPGSAASGRAASGRAAPCLVPPVFTHPLLRVATPEAWLAQACAAPDILLIDHANCEKKAASTALALMFAYAEDLEFTDKMSRLAREELRHYEQVAKLIKSSRIAPQRLSPGRYAERLRRHVAKIEPQREVDLMVCGAFIEARSCERFAALAPVIGGAAGELFAGLHAAEARHYRVYLELARRAALRNDLVLAPRIEEFAIREADLIASHDDVFRFHSGVPLPA